MISILAFPPKLDFKILVKAEFLYGIWIDGLFSERFYITCVKYKRDLFYVLVSIFYYRLFVIIKNYFLY